MKLFQFAVIGLATAGQKFETNEAERACMSACKDDSECHGQSLVEGPTECIQECRDQCVATRKTQIKQHLGARTNHKKIARKAENTKVRAEHRQLEKAINPKPMIKNFHELYEEGDVPRKFIACLRNERDKLACEGHDQELWDCKRAMVETCLDRSDDFANLGSARLVALVQEFRSSIEESQAAVARKSMEMDVTPAPTTDPNSLTDMKQNKKGKTKVSHMVKKLKHNKTGKQNICVDGECAAVEVEAKEEVAAENEPVYEDEEEEQSAEPVYEDEEESEEPEEIVYEDEEEAEDAPVEQIMENDWSDLNQVHKEEEEVEPENEDKWRKAVQNPQALYSYVGNGGSKGVNGGKNLKAKLDQKRTEVVHMDRMNKDQFIDEMCRCRTSMEHYRVKNYLVKTGEISDWKHKEDVCKWCAYPKSKKCWMCQNHWKKATDNFHGPDKAHRVRNEQIDMSCYIYVKAVKNGKFSPMNSKHTDPCPMHQLNFGKYNEWHSEGDFGKSFTTYKELHHQNGKNSKGNKSD